MKFESIYSDFKNLFPEETSYFSKAEKESVIGSDGDELSHISFGVFVMPFIYRLLKSEDDARLKKRLPSLKAWLAAMMKRYKSCCNLRFWKI